MYQRKKLLYLQINRETEIRVLPCIVESVVWAVRGGLSAFLHSAAVKINFNSPHTVRSDWVTDARIDIPRGVNWSRTGYRQFPPTNPLHSRDFCLMDCQTLPPSVQLKSIPGLWSQVTPRLLSNSKSTKFQTKLMF